MAVFEQRLHYQQLDRFFSPQKNCGKRISVFLHSALKEEAEVVLLGESHPQLRPQPLVTQHHGPSIELATLVLIEVAVVIEVEIVEGIWVVNSAS